jgi:hypothetical protein
MRPGTIDPARQSDVDREEQVVVRQRAQPAPQPEAADCEARCLGLLHENRADQESAEDEEQFNAELPEHPHGFELVRQRQEHETRVRKEHEQDRQRAQEIQAEDAGFGHHSAQQRLTGCAKRRIVMLRAECAVRVLFRRC